MVSVGAGASVVDSVALVGLKRLPGLRLGTTRLNSPLDGCETSSVRAVVVRTLGLLARMPANPLVVDPAGASVASLSGLDVDVVVVLLTPGRRALIKLTSSLEPVGTLASVVVVRALGRRIKTAFVEGLAGASVAASRAEAVTSKRLLAGRRPSKLSKALTVDDGALTVDDGALSVDKTGTSVDGASVLSSSVARLANCSLTDGSVVVVVLVVVLVVVEDGVVNGVVVRRRPMTTVFAEAAVDGLAVVVVVRLLPPKRACSATWFEPTDSVTGL